ncbi:hypothetical protein BCR32DRAFT_103207 [Anaeromyces robustus]|uniref:Uncharacterized protein n=1 Tax=Anaeromyces robustus TaxID=1754192 RepID=A0A1Y1XHA8_9FUNG|nr:hypothetical protein BCR32DRAFT_103207 [Anaeromyces robustus]|eukprot:ORX85139.1 hypothetical protein BCR32DRAFT_103207 [Anaeromyces robustus]
MLLKKIILVGVCCLIGVKSDCTKKTKAMVYGGTWGYYNKPYGCGSNLGSCDCDQDGNGYRITCQSLACICYVDVCN